MKSPAEWARTGKLIRITRWDEPIMRSQTRPVTVFDDALAQLVADMFATMAAADGVGLAAPQVNVDFAIFVFNCPDADDKLVHGVVCNPVVTLPEGKARRLVSAEEGCLSWPGAYQPLSRPDFAICEGQDETGASIRIEGTGLLARCLQHETDHLHGTVFGDRLSTRSRRKLDEEKEHYAPLYPDDWPVHKKRTAGEVA
ncbi:peptide deformylase [Propionibacterium sp.]|uniref:peptide deformylase n=1 Tax=Propionibacterium sp. TaxID=1977903 RepID=UPI0039EAA84D